MIFWAILPTTTSQIYQLNPSVKVGKSITHQANVFLLINLVVEYMKRRFKKQRIYTWAGQVLIAIHPYETFQQKDDVTPNVNSLISKLWFRLTNRIGKPNQTIVISGDSGSGKTYSANLCLNYLKNHCVSDDLLQQIWCSVPLLAAFGNASTKNNSNSSRFGKLLQLQYCDGRIEGAYIESYMLEKTRVSGPNRDEGNFNIFHQLLLGLEENELNPICLFSNRNYKIASMNRCKSDFNETINAMKVLKIDDIDGILKVIAVILNLGNVEFGTDNDSYRIEIEADDFMDCATTLLQIHSGYLATYFTSSKIAAHQRGKQRESFYMRPCQNIEECKNRRDCLVRFLYENLFLWLIEQVNAKIFKQKESCNLLALLDVYGFETFTHNTFEQLCINYVNERLQHYFVHDYILDRKLNNDEEFLISENYLNVEYTDRIMLLDGPSSVFSILNEESLMKRFSNDQFVNMRLAQTLKFYPHFIGTACNHSTDFSIRHYAGIVKYDTMSMVPKNRDKIPNEMNDILAQCQLGFIKTLLKFNAARTESSSKTTLSKFKKSLDRLMNTLDSADVHYIRCLKPNAFCITDFFETEFMIEQMRANGIMEILNLNFFQNYSIILPIDDFKKRFLQKVVDDLQLTLNTEIYINDKSAYLTEKAFKVLVFFQSYRLRKAARTLQKAWRLIYIVRYTAAVKVQRFFRRILLKKQTPCIDKFIDISKKNSTISLSTQLNEDSLKNVKAKKYAKTAEYVAQLNGNCSTEGHQISLHLEKVLQSTEMKPFERSYFSKEHVISRTRLLQVPFRLHVRKTCIPHVHLLPISEIPKGLLDILE